MPQQPGSLLSNGPGGLGGVPGGFAPSNHHYFTKVPLLTSMEPTAFPVFYFLRTHGLPCKMCFSCFDCNFGVVKNSHEKLTVKLSIPGKLTNVP